MTQSIVNKVKDSSRKYTEKQTALLHNFQLNGLDEKKAALSAGYCPTGIYIAIKSLKDELLEIAEMQLVGAAPKAASTILNLMTSKKPVPQAAVKLNASQTILDRVGLGKKDKLAIEHSVSGGIFILPTKGALIEGEILEE